MNSLNTLLRELTQLLLCPFAAWSPWVPLFVLSALLGIGMAVVFRFTSPQDKMRRVANQSRAEVLAIKLFRHDPAAISRALGRLLRHSGLRLWYSLPPLLIMVVPFALLLTHLALWYEYRPLDVGESAVVELELADDYWDVYRNITMEAPETVAIETKPLCDDGEKLISWRIRAVQPALGKLRWNLRSASIEKEFVIAIEP